MTKIFMFYFNQKRYNYWPIYEAIKKYYPLGIKKDEGGLFLQYPGLKELEKLIVDNIHDESRFKDRWVSFEEKLNLLTQRPVIGMSYGQAPSFSAYLELEAISIKNYTIFRDIYFAVSLVGPFYTVIGRNRCLAALTKERSAVGTNYLTVSPDEEYKEAFELVCSEIEHNFKSYRFVPFDINIQQLDGLDVRYSDEQGKKLFHALFNQQIDFSAQVLGDTFYKSSDWLAESQ